MARQLALWLLRFLESSLDTQLKARLDAYEKEHTEVLAQIAAERFALDRANAQLEALKAQRSEVRGQTEAAATEVGKLKEEVRKIDDEKTTVGSRSAFDVLHDRL